VAALVGEPVERPDAGFVRERTGFSIGGVPPLGHAEPLDVLIDSAGMAAAAAVIVLLRLRAPAADLRALAPERRVRE